MDFAPLCDESKLARVLIFLYHSECVNAVLRVRAEIRIFTPRDIKFRTILVMYYFVLNENPTFTQRIYM